MRKPTYLHYDCYRQVALAIINSDDHDYWKAALTGCDASGVTPLRLLIHYLPGNK